MPIARQLITSDVSEQHEESIDTFSKSMSKKLGYPVYASFNLDLPPVDVKIVCAAVRKMVYEKFGSDSAQELKQKQNEITE